MIAATDLRLAIAGKTILDGVSFSVARGEAVALVGPNGSGKTSVLRCLLGLVPFAGRATIGGHDVVESPVAARRLAGYVPQKVAFGDACAGEVLTFVARVRGVAPRVVGGMLRAVGLEAYAAARVRSFSGGMQQRLALAVALVGDPPVLLLDEPSASLDQEGQGMFRAMVADLRRRGHTLLLASHRPEEVAALTDRVFGLDGGRITATTVVTPPARVIALEPRRERR